MSSLKQEKMTLAAVMREFRRCADPAAVEGMRRFGIDSARAFGLATPLLRSMARRIGVNHSLAVRLWKEGSLESRILASMIGNPEEMTPREMDAWAARFDNWAVCDQCCLNLFHKTGHAWEKAVEWSWRDEEFIARAGFALMAVLAVHDKTSSDDDFIRLFPHIIRRSVDERNFVRKSVNWALRQIGKRNARLNREAVRTAVKIGKSSSPSARWIAADALRELKSPAVRRRLAARESSLSKRTRL
jgi:3-methyladenine DNA glycosylase AlkD